MHDDESHEAPRPDVKQARRERFGLLALFCVLPFAIAGLFWLSPWLGWPGLVVLGIWWVGSILMIYEHGKGRKT